jgi:hypothetical protein
MRGLETVCITKTKMMSYTQQSLFICIPLVASNISTALASLFTVSQINVQDGLEARVVISESSRNY